MITIYDCISRLPHNNERIITIDRPGRGTLPVKNPSRASVQRLFFWMNDNGFTHDGGTMQDDGFQLYQWTKGEGA